MPTGLRHAPRHKSAYEPGFDAIRGTGTGGIDIARADAEDRNLRMVTRLLRYGSKRGLPNMSRLQCIQELRLLDRVLDDDLSLADRIERECRR